MKKIVLFLIPLFLLFSCTDRQTFKEEKLSQEIRNSFKKTLPVLNEPNLYEIIGRKPSVKELELGRFLFNDTILSRNNDVSCATCHLANHGFADGNSINIGTLGVGGPSGDNVGKSFGEGMLSLDRTLGQDGFGFHGRNFMFRNSLSTVNVVYRVNNSTDVGLFHDGRFGKIHFQVLLPIHTPEEMCGKNPISLNNEKENIFAAGGPLFDTPVKINHSNSNDDYTGADTGFFNAQKESISGIPFYRKNGARSIPNRNECLAITIAKLRKVPYYKMTFKEVYGESGVTDLNLAKALSAFVLTHVSNRTPYDRFMKGENSLDRDQLLGLVIFMGEQGKKIKVGDKEVLGAGCINCHDTATFGGNGFASLGIKSDVRSPLSQKSQSTSLDSGFFSRPRVQRGLVPECHVEGISVLESSNYAPDIGRANGSFKSDDCFKFRIPPLRNIIETYPYYHHGTERALGTTEGDLKKRSLAALKNVIEYHLRGPVNPALYNRRNVHKPFFDEYLQKDMLIPYYAQNFVDYKVQNPSNSHFPLKLSPTEIDYLLKFIAFGLWDKKSTSVGLLGNDLSHPEEVPSGFKPSISRDEGLQTELPPSFMK